jgi:N-acetylglutamate synthase-like GNAT family acetyltransferase
VVGKPARPLFEAAVETTGSRRPLVVGDRLDTDVAGADGLGWDSLLVLTGAATRPELLRAPAVPTYLGPDLSAVLGDLPPARVRKAGRGDLKAIAELLHRSGLDPAGAEARLDHTIVCADRGDDGLTATACLEPNDEAGILWSVAVREGLRGTGLGALVVAEAIRVARAEGVSTVWLFTETAERFFQGLGFRRAHRNSLPDPIVASMEAAGCAASAVAMSIRL